MSHAAYNKELLSKWCEVAPKILDDGIEKLFQEYLNKRVSCAFERYKFWKKIFPWLKEPKKEDYEYYERESAYGVHVDAAMAFYGCRRAIKRIHRFCRTSDGENIFLDQEDVYFGLSKLGYENWKGKQLKKMDNI